MIEYRFYLLTDDNHIRWAETMAAADDIVALQVARQLARTGPVEVWQSARLLARIDCDAAAKPILRRDRTGS